MESLTGRSEDPLQYHRASSHTTTLKVLLSGNVDGVLTKEQRFNLHVFLWTALQHTDPQKETLLLFASFIWLRTSSVTLLSSLFVSFHILALKWIELWERLEARGGTCLLRGHCFTQSLLIPERHFETMTAVIKVRRMSARDRPMELWEELIFPSVGCSLIGWQGRVHLHMEDRRRRPVTGPRRRRGNEKSQFLWNCSQLAKQYFGAFYCRLTHPGIFCRSRYFFFLLKFVKIAFIAICSVS